VRRDKLLPYVLLDVRSDKFPLTFWLDVRRDKLPLTFWLDIPCTSYGEKKSYITFYDGVSSYRKADDINPYPANVENRVSSY
jgi:hypothetical protein